MLDTHPIIQHLLGCAWGRSLSTPDDTEPCPDKADRIVILHKGTEEHEVRLCLRHVERVKQESVPHEGST